MVQGFHQRSENSYDWISLCHKAIPEPITIIRRLDTTDCVTYYNHGSQNICQYLGLILGGDREWVLAKLSSYCKACTDRLDTSRDSNVGREFR